MKSFFTKLFALFSVFPIFASSLLVQLFAPENSAGLDWEEEIITVFSAENGSYVSYPRMLELADGTLICGYDTDSKICCVKSTDGGLTWEKEQTLVARVDGLSCANAALIQLESGEILCAYRANGTVASKFYSSIRVSSSKDGGKSWVYHSTVAQEQQSSDAFFGLWEPHFGFIGDELAVFYSNDSQNAVQNAEQQNIEFKLWQNGAWSEKRLACSGELSNSRDGMPVWCQTYSGKYVLAIEATTLRQNEAITRSFVVDMLVSDDGLNWSKRTTVAMAPLDSGAVYTGAPFVVELPDGRLCLSYQTDNGASFEGGSKWICNVVTTNRPFSGRVSMLSFTKPFEPFGSQSASAWNGMLVCGNKLLVFTTSSDSQGSRLLLRRADI